VVLLSVIMMPFLLKSPVSKIISMYVLYPGLSASMKIISNSPWRVLSVSVAGPSSSLTRLVTSYSVNAVNAIAIILGSKSSVIIYC
jgi:hypothetical protein